MDLALRTLGSSNDDLRGGQQNHLLDGALGPLAHRVEPADGFEPVSPEFQAEREGIEGGDEDVYDAPPATE